MGADAAYRYVKVALNVPLPRTFDYKIAEATTADVGRRVKVSFGARRQLGVIVAVTDTPEVSPDKLKEIDEILTDIPPLSTALLSLFHFCSQYYHHPLGQVIFTALPTRLRKTDAFQPNVIRYFQATHDFRAALPKQASVQHRLATALSTPVSTVALTRMSAQAKRYLMRWLAQGWIEEVAPNVLSQSQPSAPSLQLHQAQQHAVQAISTAQGFRPFLLYGVTGSGKTEVYLHTIAEQLRQSRQILLLVPEINLTPQLELHFKARFPAARIVSLHSEVNASERANIWLQAERGEVDIVLGTRLAVFTPLPRLGLIVVDEEHDASFKQQEGLRYHARDVAVFRAKQANIPIVLGSATPALESWYNAQQSRYQLLRLPHRAVANAQLPHIHLLGTDNVRLHDGLHPEAMTAIDQALARQEQVLVFLNRRGYAPVLHCQQCGWLADCQRCTSRLVVHLRAGLLKCHLCGHEAQLPRACLSCGNTDLQPVGQGTQRLESALKILFPQAEVIRVDRDSMCGKASWTDALHRVKAGQAQILVGTQMLAKGHDFPNLGLAVLLNTDAGLYSADFRAEERLFAQLMQVAGRVGRAHITGHVFVQTRYPTHPLYSALQQYDYAPFADYLLQARQHAHFPPYCFQAVLRAEAHHLDEVLGFLQYAKALAPNSEVHIYTPVPALVQKVAGKERAQLLLQASSRSYLHSFIQHWLGKLRGSKASKVRWTIDIDPIEV